MVSIRSKPASESSASVSTRVFQETRRGFVGPGQGIDRVTLGAQAVLRQGEEPARLDHPKGLGKKSGAIGHVHGDVLCVGAVEERVFIGQGGTVADPKIDLVDHAGAPVQLLASFDKARRDIDSRDPTPKPLCHVSGWAANRAADVENVLIVLDGQAIREVDRCRQPSRMKMIDRCQIENAEIVER